MSTGPQKIESLMTRETTPASATGMQAYYRDDEISLVELWLLLWDYRRVVIASIVVAMAFAGLVSFILPAKYESTAVLKIGKLAGIGAIEEANALAAKIRLEHKIDDDSEGKKVAPYLVKATAASGKRDDQSMVTLVATGESAQQAAEFLDKEMDSIIQKHKLLFDNGVASIKNSKNQAETQQQENITQLKYLDEQVAQSDSLEVRSTLIQEKAILIRQNGELSEKILATERMLSELQTYPTEIVRSASLPLKPIRPKPLLYVAIAAFVGLFIGLGLIMLTEFSRHVRAASSK